MGFIGRLAQRARGADGAVRPSVDRWNVARSAPGEAGTEIANESFAAPPPRTPPPEFASAPRVAIGRASPEQPIEGAARPIDRDRFATQTPGLPAPDPHEQRPIFADPAPRSIERRETATTRERVTLVERTEHLREVAAAARLLPSQPSPALAPTRAIREAQAAPAAIEPAPVYVHIGRIDVRAAGVPAAKTAPPARSALRKPSLEAHLSARDRGVL